MMSMAGGWFFLMLSETFELGEHKFRLPGLSSLEARRRRTALALTISSPAFENGAEIPKRYTCDGEDVSPELRFGGVPQGAKSLALIVHDPDAPDPKAPRMDWVHWTLYNLPPTTTVLREGVGAGDLPPGTLLSIGTAVLEVSAKPHTGCAKFIARFGEEAMRFVNSPEGRKLRLRGVNTRVVVAGTVRVGDEVRKV